MKLRWFSIFLVFLLGPVSLPAPAGAAETAPERRIPLTDGTEIVGRVKSFTEDDAVIFVHRDGVRRIPLHRVEEPERSQLRQEYRDRRAAAIEQFVEEVTPVAEKVGRDFGEAIAASVIENYESNGDEWILLGGIGLLALSAVLMFFASFAESPTWGLCYILTSGLSWFPFIFLCFKKAWFPTLVGIVGMVSLGWFFWAHLTT
ncbi:MAG: hypothetical protein KDN19_19135 [Verrucomicrobiae bacterium]|nr:hypothetical protein [Verrucomicrobiae bacterium]